MHLLIDKNTMGLFDFLFSKKKERKAREEAERQEQLRQARMEQEKRRRAAEEERRKRNAEEEERKKRMEQQNSIKPFVFKSTQHQRYQNGTEVGDLQHCVRTLTVEKNVNGCQGYKITPGVGYIVKLFNDELGKPQMSDKPMKVVSKTASKVELRGYPLQAMGPFGWMDVDYSDYGLTIYYNGEEVEKCVFHMFDRNVDLEYMNVHSSKVEDNIHSETSKVSKSQPRQALEKPNTELYSTNQEFENELEFLASNANLAYNVRNVKAAVNLMNRLFTACYGKNGHKLLYISKGACMPVGFAFASIAMHLNFDDKDMNSVAAENAFYCLARNFIADNNTFSVPAIFTLLYKYSKLLNDALIAANEEVLERQSSNETLSHLDPTNPIAILKAGEIKRRAVNKRFSIMSYLLPFFFDVVNDSYKIPTDMPYNIPTKDTINRFQAELEREKNEYDGDIAYEGQKYFYAMFEHIQDTLSKCR